MSSTPKAASTSAKVRAKHLQEFLTAACLRGHLKDVLFACNSGALLDEKDEGGFTALYAASQNGHLNVVRLLCERGATVDLQGTDGLTALYMASQNGHLEVVRHLCERGASLDLQDTRRSTDQQLFTEPLLRAI